MPFFRNIVGLDAEQVEEDTFAASDDTALTCAWEMKDEEDEVLVIHCISSMYSG